ncbi:50S ribosomal protein L25/general stress protein Ctc [Oscillatoria sp. CS-180]|uniref:50S ribosomal protein L25/general stress protein Ctc n=1 Tax=Oscillatoria sp. CS-180 TaxID=3021720 RepID=UPI00232AA4F5|nr:50S ribosomal protein L25/general stress protein Ctc [Oscillatoria sp. CS-180]MDB9525649.1 50S ribosomal protein L25/general stress protein Ctc [Oscillatoria sp. CS-180]
MELSIECSKRQDGANPRALRREGLVPAVLYGHDGANSVSLLVNEREAQKLVRQASVNNSLITVKVPDMPWSGQALLREVQTHPWKGNLYHLSFFSIASQSSVQVEVPLHFTGTAKGVRDEGGVLDIIVSQLGIQCAPGAIPETVDVDVSDLAVGDNLHISDLKLPKGVEAISDTDKTVVMIAAPRTVASEEAEEAVVEVIPTLEA